MSGKEAKHVAKRLTTADKTGKPSVSDMKDLALGPAPAISSASKALSAGKGRKGPKGRKVDLPPLPGSLEGGSSIASETTTNAGPA